VSSRTSPSYHHLRARGIDFPRAAFSEASSLFPITLQSSFPKVRNPTSPVIRRFFLRFGLWTVTILTLVGCTQPVKLQGDAGDARQTLTKVCEAWKDGQTTKSFSQQTPPWVVADEDWDGGAKLIEFEIGEPIAFGGHWRVLAKLKLNSEKRGEHSRNVAYAVTLQPAVSIIRADDVLE